MVLTLQSVYSFTRWRLFSQHFHWKVWTLWEGGSGLTRQPQLDLCSIPCKIHFLFRLIFPAPFSISARDVIEIKAFVINLRLIWARALAFGVTKTRPEREAEVEPIYKPVYLSPREPVYRRVSYQFLNWQFARDGRYRELGIARHKNEITFVSKR